MTSCAIQGRLEFLSPRVTESLIAPGHPSELGAGGAGGRFPVALVFHWDSQPSLGMSACLSFTLLRELFCLEEHVAAQIRDH